MKTYFNSGTARVGSDFETTVRVGRMLRDPQGVCQYGLALARPIHHVFEYLGKAL